MLQVGCIGSECRRYGIHQSDGKDRHEFPSEGNGNDETCKTTNSTSNTNNTSNAVSIKKNTDNINMANKKDKQHSLGRVQLNVVDHLE